MEFDQFGAYLGALGSIASLVALVFYLIGDKNKDKRLHIIALLILVMGLTGLSSYFSFNYYKVTQPEYVKLKLRESMIKSAKSFIRSHEGEIGYWTPGKNEGIAKSGLLILEMHKDLFPENYARIKADVENEITFSKGNRDQYLEKSALEAAAQAVYSTMETLANQSPEEMK